MNRGRVLLSRSTVCSMIWKKKIPGQIWADQNQIYILLHPMLTLFEETVSCKSNSTSPGQTSNFGRRFIKRIFWKQNLSILIQRSKMFVLEDRNVLLLQNLTGDQLLPDPILTQISNACMSCQSQWVKEIHHFDTRNVYSSWAIGQPFT